MSQAQITFRDISMGNKIIKLINITGQLDETNVDHEAQKIYQIIDEMSEPNIILDFSGLEFLNSKAIGYITDWYSKIMNKNGKIIITQPHANILDILNVVGIAQIVKIYDTLNEAKVDFGAKIAPETPAVIHDEKLT